MSIQMMDNWNIYGFNNANLLNGVYAELDRSGLIASPDPNDGGKPVYRTVAAQALDSVLRYVLSSPQTTVGTAQRIWLDSLPNDPNQQHCVFSVLDGSNSLLYYARFTTTGALALYDSGNTQLAISSGPVITANAFWHVECKMVLDPSIGSFEARVEGVPVITLSAQNFGSTPVSQVRIYSQGNNNTPFGYWKDYVIWDGSGASNNDFLGTVIVYSLLPAVDISNGWTLTGGTSAFSILDNAPPQDGVEFLTAPLPLPAPVVTSLTALPNNVTSVRGLMSMVRARKDDGGDGSLQNSLVSGSSTVDGVNRPITAAFTYWRDQFPVDPATGNPWTITAANAVQLKINRTV